MSATVTAYYQSRPADGGAAIDLEIEVDSENNPASPGPDVPVGTPVRIINEPYVAGWRDGELYLEAHQPLAEDAARWKQSLEPMQQAVAATAAQASAEVNWERATTVAREVRGIPLPVSPGSRGLAELLAKAPRVPSRPPWAPAQYESDALMQRSSSDEPRASPQSSAPSS